jgi:hypothetical protein
MTRTPRVLSQRRLMALLSLTILLSLFPFELPAGAQQRIAGWGYCIIYAGEAPCSRIAQQCLKFRATGSAKPGVYSATIAATSGSTKHTASLSVSVVRLSTAPQRGNSPKPDPT